MNSRSSTMRLATLLLTMGPTILGCATADPNTAAGKADIAGQQCAVCIYENPGDSAPCRAICMEREADQAAYMKAYGH